MDESIHTKTHYRVFAEILSRRGPRLTEGGQSLWDQRYQG